MLFANIYKNHSHIIVPQIYKQYWDNKPTEFAKFGFSMPYYYASDFIMFFENSTTTNIIKMLSILLNFIDKNILDSKYIDRHDFDLSKSRKNSCCHTPINNKTHNANNKARNNKIIESKFLKQSLQSLSKETNEEINATESKQTDSIESRGYKSKEAICKYINKEVLLDKYYDTIAKIPKNKDKQDYLLHIEKELKALPNSIQIPLGKCHGDLTFSNILFTDRKIILIDFLDNFIETPLQDIVKLRQDTKHLWSLKLYKREYDKTKIKIILNHLDNIIDKHFSKYEFYRKYYSIFQKINLLRILPYVKDESIFQYVVNEIIKLNKKDTICQRY